MWTRSEIETPLGPMIAMTDGAVLTALVFHDDARESVFAQAKEAETEAVIAARTVLDRYFSGQECADLPRTLSSGTDFQKEVWLMAKAIPAGRTETYSGIARRLGRPSAARAVASALAANPILILTPCHRVIPAEGVTGGYAGGPRRKAALLTMEGQRSRG